MSNESQNETPSQKAMQTLVELLRSGDQNTRFAAAQAILNAYSSQPKP